MLPKEFLNDLKFINSYASFDDWGGASADPAGWGSEGENGGGAPPAGPSVPAYNQPGEDIPGAPSSYSPPSTPSTPSQPGPVYNPEVQVPSVENKGWGWSSQGGYTFGGQPTGSQGPESIEGMRYNPSLDRGLVQRGLVVAAPQREQDIYNVLRNINDTQVRNAAANRMAGKASVYDMEVLARSPEINPTSSGHISALGAAMESIATGNQVTTRDNPFGDANAMFQGQSKYSIDKQIAIERQSWGFNYGANKEKYWSNPERGDYLGWQLGPKSQVTTLEGYGIKGQPGTPEYDANLQAFGKEKGLWGMSTAQAIRQFPGLNPESAAVATNQWSDYNASKGLGGNSRTTPYSTTKRDVSDFLSNPYLSKPAESQLGIPTSPLYNPVVAPELTKQINADWGTDFMGARSVAPSLTQLVSSVPVVGSPSVAPFIAPQGGAYKSDILASVGKPVFAGKSQSNGLIVTVSNTTKEDFMGNKVWQYIVADPKTNEYWTNVLVSGTKPTDADILKAVGNTQGGRDIKSNINQAGACFGPGLACTGDAASVAADLIKQSPVPGTLLGGGGGLALSNVGTPWMPPGLYEQYQAKSLSKFDWNNPLAEIGKALGIGNKSPLFSESQVNVEPSPTKLQTFMGAVEKSSLSDYVASASPALASLFPEKVQRQDWTQKEASIKSAAKEAGIPASQLQSYMGAQNVESLKTAGIGVAAIGGMALPAVVGGPILAGASYLGGPAVSMGIAQGVYSFNTPNEADLSQKLGEQYDSALKEAYQKMEVGDQKPQLVDDAGRPISREQFVSQGIKKAKQSYAENRPDMLRAAAYGVPGLGTVLFGEDIWGSKRQADIASGKAQPVQWWEPALFGVSILGDIALAAPVIGGTAQVANKVWGGMKEAGTLLPSIGKAGTFGKEISNLGTRAGRVALNITGVGLESVGLLPAVVKQSVESVPIVAPRGAKAVMQNIGTGIRDWAGQVKYPFAHPVDTAVGLGRVLSGEVKLPEGFLMGELAHTLSPVGRVTLQNRETGLPEVFINPATGQKASGLWSGAKIFNTPIIGRGINSEGGVSWMRSPPKEVWSGMNVEGMAPLTQTVFQTKYLNTPTFLKSMGATEETIALAQSAPKMLGLQSYLRPQIPKGENLGNINTATKVLSKEEVTAGNTLATKLGGQLNRQQGSSTINIQLSKEARGWRPIGDIDLETNLLSKGTAKVAEQFKSTIAPEKGAFIKPSEPNTIYIRTPNGPEKAYEIKSAEQGPLAPTQAFGIRLGESAVKVKGSPYFSSLSETTKNKLQSVFTLNPQTGRMEPISSNTKDIYDAYIALKRQTELDPRVQPDLDRYSNYYKMDIKAAEKRFGPGYVPTPSRVNTTPSPSYWGPSSLAIGGLPSLSPSLASLGGSPSLASLSPSFSTSMSPSRSPSMSPSRSLSPSPSMLPSLSPSPISWSNLPSLGSPSPSPSLSPSSSPSLSKSPSPSPSFSPSPSPSPSKSPSPSPSPSPSRSLSPSPSKSPSPIVMPPPFPTASAPGGGGSGGPRLDAEPLGIWNMSGIKVYGPSPLPGGGIVGGRQGARVFRYGRSEARTQIGKKAKSKLSLIQYTK